MGPGAFSTTPSPRNWYQECGASDVAVGHVAVGRCYGRQGLVSCQVEPLAALSLGLPSTAGWLLNLQHLTLGAQIGEGEFGGEQGTWWGLKEERAVPIDELTPTFDTYLPCH